MEKTKKINLNINNFLAMKSDLTGRRSMSEWMGRMGRRTRRRERQEMKQPSDFGVTVVMWLVPCDACKELIWWLEVVGSGWWWLKVVGGGWRWLEVIGGGWWSVVVGSGWWWLVVAGGGRWWLEVVGSG